MHSILQTTTTRRHVVHSSPETAFRSPQFDCRPQDGALRVLVYVPGVEPAGVEIVASDTDLTVTACKPHPVRPNWSALQLERAQRDYRLRLRLGHGYDYAALSAELRDGVLTLTLPDKTHAAEPLPRVA
jgi:HSP20 family molecular chaperone IbpA